MNQPRKHKAISPQRDRWQSQSLVAVCAAVLAVYPVVWLRIWPVTAGSQSRVSLLAAGAVSVGFAGLVWLLKAATKPAAVLGGIICYDLVAGTELGRGMAHSALPALSTLFLLTFLATRFRRSHKQAMGLAEPRTGRRASQVAANLAVAAGMGMAGFCDQVWVIACLAALAEATADTVSSEMGQVFGGRTLLLTTWQPVEPGTDGGISLRGTFAGLAAAGVVVMVGVATMGLGWREGGIAFTAGAMGLFADSLLGATLERKGWMGNDWVNFFSTGVAATCAVALGQLAR